MSSILKNTMGCDFVLELPESRKNTKIKLLQLTDMQIIDAEQRRTPDRLRPDEIEAWAPDKFDINCGNQIRSLVTQTKPDMIFMTGDLVYGSFDDAGTTFEWFCNFMDSLEIPWAPVFGNHDNETARGVEWQCERLASSKYCMFERGNVTGNGNYTVGIAAGGELVRVLYMIDTNGCAGMTPAGIYPDQVEFVTVSCENIAKACGRKIPAFAAFHIETKDFATAARAKGYITDERSSCIIGVDVPSKDGDFGMNYEGCEVRYKTMGDHLEMFKNCAVDGVFTGHTHNNSTCISWEGIKWVYGLKTGQYDYHVPCNMGGTLVTLEDGGFEVAHVPALTPMAPFPGGAGFFKNVFVPGSYKN